MWSYIKKWFNQLFNKKEEIVIEKQVKPVKQNKHKKTKRTKALRLWGDDPKTTGVISTYKNGRIKYYYHSPNGKYKYFESSYENCLTFAKKFQQVNYDLNKWNDVRYIVLPKKTIKKHKATYISKRADKYLIQKNINGKCYHFGYWRTKPEAEQVVEWLKSKEWDTDYSTRNARGYSQQEYRAEIRSYMKIDEEIQNKLGE